MSIEIKTIKIVRDDGVLARKIIAINALGFCNLPSLYKNSNKRAVILYEKYLKKLCVLNIDSESKCNSEYYIGALYDEVEFQDLLEHCKDAGKHLKECNAALKNKRGYWKGQESFVI